MVKISFVTKHGFEVKEKNGKENLEVKEFKKV